jgi:hypothetical protein
MAEVGGGHHRLEALVVVLALRSAKDPPLASGVSATHTGVHSQNPRGDEAMPWNPSVVR